VSPRKGRLRRFHDDDDDDNRPVGWIMAQLPYDVTQLLKLDAEHRVRRPPQLNKSTSRT